MLGPSQHLVDGIPVLRLESDLLRVEIAPSVGGRIISLIEKSSGHEFLWRNPNLPLQALLPGSEYDPNFYGGIDELLPNDVPETINGIDCPDHGELWTTPLSWRQEQQNLVLEGRLARFGLDYSRAISLGPATACLDFKYRISNFTSEPREFLWKLHAALAVQAGDIVDCPARWAQVVDPAWSRFKTLAPFSWPKLDGVPVNVVPDADGMTDFFYLFDLAAGEIRWRRPGSGHFFSYIFDSKIFRYAWMFASYGGFNGHYTVILEPCTAMPISVNQAAAKKQCSHLEAGQSIETSVSIVVGGGRQPG